MKTMITRAMKRQTLSFENIYQNKGFVADAFHFSLIDVQMNDESKKKPKTKRALNVKKFFSCALYSTVLLTWFTFYFVVFGTIRIFTMIKL